MTDKQLDASWQVFRFLLRDTAAEFARAHVARISSFPLEPTDPERLEPVVDAVLSELDRDSEAKEASPVVRAVRKAFAPSPEERDRKKLKKAFDAYSRAWRARRAG